MMVDGGCILEFLHFVLFVYCCFVFCCVCILQFVFCSVCILEFLHFVMFVFCFVCINFYQPEAINTLCKINNKLYLKKRLKLHK